ncbi:type V toxin-antitoxin system endoribonuclease antitoxin GhoS [Yersinia enterocolitica]|uniref:type V toxin-antitoxin system endoribonuclease antitoxin GhoS n=1 Tax=Yersinia enterocolitica TaxID=630 RepID=UPI003D7A20E1
MANFLVRVELYDASSEHYDALYERMKAIGFHKEVNQGGKTYDLPTGTYVGTFGVGAEAVRKMVSAIADQLSSKAASVFACSFEDWSAYLYPPS